MYYSSLNLRVIFLVSFPKPQKAYPSNRVSFDLPRYVGKRKELAYSLPTYLLAGYRKPTQHWVPEVFSRVGQGASSHEKPLSPRVQRAKNERFIINSTDSSTPQWGNHLLIKYRKNL